MRQSISLRLGVNKTKLDMADFKVLAVKVLPGCNNHIRKVLFEDRWYIFYKDYGVTQDGKWLKRKSYVSVPVDFYRVNNVAPNISISAIVGKNGDGKSSLIELIVRILNNVAYSAYRDLHDSLMRVEGLWAELFFSIDNSVYCFKCEDYKVSFMTSSNSCIPVDKAFRQNYAGILFYTDVTNYSIYSYNTFDFCEALHHSSWIDSIFHKNDGYQTPIVLNPFRESGVIDINSEAHLTRQRLMVLCMQDINGDGVRDINENCDADSFSIKKVSYSKLFGGFEQFCKVVKSRVELNNSERRFERATVDCFLHNVKYLISNYPYLVEIAKSTNKNGLVDLQGFLALYQKDGWIKNESKEVYDFLNNVTYVQMEKMMEIAVIDQVWQNIFKNGRFLLDERVSIKTKSDIEGNILNTAYSYLVEKTADIFQTYRHLYKYSILNVWGKDPLLHTPIEELHKWLLGVDANSEEKPFQILLDDIIKGKSHITLKLRQTLYFMLYNRNNSVLREAFNDGSEKESSFEEYYDSIIPLCQEYGLELIELLPPPIFEWDILVERDGEKFPSKYLSSGERQRLYSISSVLYNLRNLDTIAKGNIQYQFVNLVFEEIELYFHPAYQQGFVKFLLEQIAALGLRRIKGINICFVTHSPFILSDIPKSNVIFLEDGEPVEHMQENTFGANIHALLQHGFLLEGVTMGAFAKDKINHLFEKLNNGEVTESMYQEILLVGEPYIRGQLLKLYHDLVGDNSKKIKMLEEQIKELRRKIDDKN